MNVAGLQHLVLGWLVQPEQMREFFIQMGVQNLAQARQGHSVKPAAQLVTASVVIFSKPPSELTADIEGGKK